MTRVIHFFSRFGILQRALLMSILFVVILVTGFLFVLSEVGTMHTTADRVGSAVDNQNTALEEQSALLERQEKMLQQQSLILNAYNYYNLFIYWRFDSVITGERNSLKEAATAEDALLKNLTKFGELDDEAADMASLLRIANPGAGLEETADDSARINASTYQTAEQLRCEADLVAAATTQMAVTVRGINDNTAAAFEQATAALEACGAGRSSLAGTTTAITQLASQIQDTAEDIRTLAKRTQDSTAQIQIMISGRQKAENTLQQAGTTAAAIDIILSAVDAISLTNQQISETTREQMLAAESIDQSINSISKLSTALTSAAESTSAGSAQLRKTVVSMNQVLGSFRLHD